jgi:two-component system, NarL family, nitrate/nitrite response regulator NarL
VFPVTNVAAYSAQPILIAGLQAVIGAAPDLALTAVAMNVSSLIDELPPVKPDVILAEVTPELSLEALHQLTAAARVPIVLWVDAVSVEFVSQVIGLGIRGILRKTLGIAPMVECLRKVAAGELWIEKDLCDRLLSTKRVALTPRERQLLALLAQGLKNKEIAWSLQITEGTVKVYLSRLFQKVGVNDRFELALFALKNFVASPVGIPAQLETFHASVDHLPPAAGFLPTFVSFDRQVQ